ncbi:hypothetical protein VKT23_011924 [Stygiomarasmius scandens]|uniref:Integrase catalytic domain-containing protein n=1 Tax=Marasmiellus scandens TaxID=2682957 RepID=A0ABR1J9X4_9AGAR
MAELRKLYPKAGLRDMTDLFWRETEIRIPRSLVDAYFKEYEPHLIRERRARRFKQKIFWSAGLFDVVSVDQHDKWRDKYGLCLHLGVECTAGQLLWLKIWWTNRNPRLITSYYLEWVEEVGYTCLVTQSDPGSENYGLANAHTALRHWHDPNLEGTLSHRWMRARKNIKGEIEWRQFRRRFSPGWENLLDEGLKHKWYDPKIPRENYIFRWVFIPMLQSKLDAYRQRFNRFPKRRDRNKILPQGRPDDIVERPQDFQVLDFRVKVEPEAIQQVRAEYIPATENVFQLVPAPVAEVIEAAYNQIEQPEITSENCWTVYLAILNIVEEQAFAVALGVPDLDKYFTDSIEATETVAIPLTEDRNPLENGPGVRTKDGNFYYGGVNHGRGLDADDSLLSYTQSNTDRDTGLESDDDNDEPVDEAFGIFSDDEEDDIPM